MIDAAISSSSNQHIMLCSSTTAFGSNRSEAADQVASYRLLNLSLRLLPALHAHQLLRRPMQLTAAFRLCAHRSDILVEHCTGAALATHQGNLGSLPSCLRHLFGWLLATPLPPPAPLRHWCMPHRVSNR